jgi:MoaA/NifB/PqqE/SkfB family radical SAM enzyme
MEMRTKATRLKSRPVIAKIEASSYCNLKCLGCRTGEGAVTYPPGNMSVELFQRILRELGDYLLEIVFYLWGEPAINKDLPLMIDMAHERNISVSVSSNLHFIDESCSKSLLDSSLDKLIVAIDGFSQETYQSVRVGGNFERALGNLQTIARMKKERRAGRPYIEWQYILTDDTIPEVERAREFAGKIGVNRFVLLQDWAGRLTDWTYFKNLPRFRKRLSAKKMSCYWLYTAANIQWDGAVFPCCYVANKADSERVYGDISNRSFADIWNNESFMAAREILKTGVESNRLICGKCLTPPVFSSRDEDRDRGDYD